MSFTFSWPHAAREVFVTGTFDDWSKSVKLDKTATGHEKTVPLPQTSEKVLYKVCELRARLRISAAQTMCGIGIAKVGR